MSAKTTLDLATLYPVDEANGSDREATKKQLKTLGFNAEMFEDATDIQLQHLLKGTLRLLNEYESKMGGISSNKDRNLLTEVDKKMLRSLLLSKGRVSSLALSRKLEIPLTTVQRRRKRLESEFLEVNYSLSFSKLGWRRAHLFISCDKGRTSMIGKDLLEQICILSVSRSMGEHTIDLHAEIIFNNNTELINLIDWIKAIEGVKDLMWTEPVEIIGKRSVPVQIIGQE